MKKQHGKDKCPAKETLNEFFDGHLDAESPEHIHISSCHQCRKTLDDYTIIAESIKKSFSQSVPKNLDSRILGGVERRLRLEQPPRPLIPMILRVAASIAAAALIVVIFLKESGKSRATSLVDDTREEYPPPALTEQRPTHDFTPTLHHSPGQAIHSQNISPASTAHAPTPRFVEDVSDEKPAAIHKEVRHIWVTRNPDEASAIIRAATNKKNILMLQKNDLGDIEAELIITKAQLVSLVRKCHAAGFSLLSPAQPQPEQSLFFGNKNDDVKYLATFTRQ